MAGRRDWAAWLIGILVLSSVLSTSQQQPQSAKPPADIPDAPSATRPPQPPTLPPGQAAPPPNQTPPTDTTEAPGEQPPAEHPSTGPTPSESKTVPGGGATASGDNTREQLYTLRRRVDFVVVPVTVKDTSGHMVNGLLPKDFAVYESGIRQKLTFFTPDPFFLSVAVIFDLGLPDVSVQKINQTYPALVAAFSQWDQVSIYTYSTAVTRLTDFTSANQKLAATLNELKLVRGTNSGVPVLTGPLASPPTVNDIPVGSGVQPVYTAPKQAHVLNDAILRAALDLAKQDRTRRKVIFIISDGREQGSTASYADTLKVLLSNEIEVYGVATDSSALPGYKQLSRLHLPHQAYDNLLPRYAVATGGEVFHEFSQSAIERAYANAMGETRNQYTMGYQTKAASSSHYREIEVKVDIPDLKVRAKYGYYPLPPARE